MTANQFLDTNILVYAFDSSDPAKQQLAEQLIVATANRCGCTEIISEDLSHGQSYNRNCLRRALLGGTCDFALSTPSKNGSHAPAEFYSVGRLICSREIAHPIMRSTE